MNKKTVIIGLDGGTFEIITPLVQRELLPFLAGIIKNGTHGVLKSTRPPVTAPAWTTFATGKNPGKHGLFDFQKIDSSGDRVLTYSTDCKSATLWDYLSESGKRILLVNIPMTYPPMPVNGIVVAGFPVPRNSVYTYPAEKHDWITNLGYLTDQSEIMHKNKWKSRISILKDIERVRIDIFSKLLKSESWDVAMVVISGTDHISHLEWQKGNRKAVEDFYIFIDGLFKNLDERGLFNDASVMLMSDHGFIQSEYIFYINNWLMREGYMKGITNDNTYDKFLEERRTQLYGKRGRVSKILGKAGLSREKVKFIAKKMGIIRFERYLPHSFSRIFPSKNIVPDWELTKVYAVSQSSKGLNINLAGREKNGIVPVSQYNQLREEIIEKLRSFKLDDGTDVFEYVDIKENIYSGSHTDKSPDILLWPANKCNVKAGKPGSTYLEKIIDAHHTTDGIFILKGSGIKKGYSRDINIEDLAPTLMHLWDLPCPDDLDGIASTDIFENDSHLSKREVKYRSPITRSSDEPELDIDEESIKRQLKSLGYF